MSSLVMFVIACERYDTLTGQDGEMQARCNRFFCKPAAPPAWRRGGLRLCNIGVTILNASGGNIMHSPFATRAATLRMRRSDVSEDGTLLAGGAHLLVIAKKLGITIMADFPPRL